jgi:MtN3 and saliva related transmembrane protein
MPDTPAVVGTIASVLTISAFIPQALRSWRTKSTKDLSYGTVVLLVSQSAAWLSYGVLLRDPALMITNSVTAVCALLILTAKLRFG